MRIARDLCNENGYKHLVIPKDRTYKNFIFESKLPDGQTREMMTCYLDNLERFTDVVKEFAGFRCQASLGDITGYADRYAKYFGLLPRYDNLFVYLEGDQEKIEFVDLEQFQPGYPNREPFIGVEKAIQIFPCHFDEIMEVAKNFFPEIENMMKMLTQVQRQLA